MVAFGNSWEGIRRRRIRCYEPDQEKKLVEGWAEKRKENLTDGLTWFPCRLHERYLAYSREIFIQRCVRDSRHSATYAVLIFVYWLFSVIAIFSGYFCVVVDYTLQWKYSTVLWAPRSTVFEPRVQHSWLFKYHKYYPCCRKYFECFIVV